jgi:Holliday junction resolvase-like predicted endonuclease
MRFILNGTSVQLSREQVEKRLRDVPPEPIQKHAVRINNVWYPVKQAFERAIGVSRNEFRSHSARRHLAALGFEMHGAVEPRDSPHAESARPRPHRADRNSRPTSQSSRDESWHTEASVQAAVVSHLARQGWRVLSVADTVSRQHGIDIVADKHGRAVGVEVKGFPSRNYADPGRAAEVKRTQPTTQARHWYAQAILAAMLTSSRRTELEPVIALPDLPRYRNLHSDTRKSLDACGIVVWWVSPAGEVVEGLGI